MKNLNLTTRRQAGFTMIELLFTIVIIGILTSLAAGAYSQFKSKASATEAMSMVSATMVATEAAYAAKSTWPTGNDEAGLNPSTDYHGNYVSDIVVSPDGIGVSFKAALETGLGGARLQFVPYLAAHGGIIWACEGGAVPLASDGITPLSLATGAALGNNTTVALPFRPAICAP